jgi:hypothetical protein
MNLKRSSSKEASGTSALLSTRTSPPQTFLRDSPTNSPYTASLSCS